MGIGRIADAAQHHLHNFTRGQIDAEHAVLQHLVCGQRALHWRGLGRTGQITGRHAQAGDFGAGPALHQPAEIEAFADLLRVIGGEGIKDRVVMACKGMQGGGGHCQFGLAYLGAL